MKRLDSTKLAHARRWLTRSILVGFLALIPASVVLWYVSATIIWPGTTDVYFSGRWHSLFANDGNVTYASDIHNLSAYMSPSKSFGISTSREWHCLGFTYLHTFGGGYDRWFFDFPVWMLALPGIATVIWYPLSIRQRRIKYRLKMGLCPNCGYDLRATLDRCPECGTVKPKAEGLL